MDSLHEVAVEAPLEWAALGSRVVEVLEASGPELGVAKSAGIS